MLGKNTVFMTCVDGFVLLIMQLTYWVDILEKE